MRDRLYRSRVDRVIGGVAGGLAESLNVDPSIVRVVWVILAFMTGGLFALVYLVMLIVVPEEPGDEFDWEAGRAVPPGAAPFADTGSAVTDAGTTTDPAPAGEPGWEEPTAATDASPRSAWRDERAARRAARREARSSGRPGSGGLVFGVILILLGGYFLLRQYVPQLDLDLTWPIIVIVLGALLIVASLRSSGRGRD